jgi:hypothetical protein
VRTVSISCALLLGALVPAQASAESQQRLTFADPDPLTISVENGAKTASKAVVLVHSGAEISEPTFAAVSGDADAPTVEVTASGSSAVPANGAARIELSFTSDDSIDGFEGHLIAATDGAAAERDLKIDAKNEIPFSVNLIIFGSLLIGGGLAALRAVTLHDRLAYRLATPGWDFSKSWASTFTVVGAVLGTILASLVLPDTPERFSKETLAGMNLVFGVAILVAPFLFAATESPRLVKKDDSLQVQGQGTVAGYLLACAVTLTGVLGQLATVFFLLGEIETKGALPDEALVFLVVLLAIAALLVLLYAWRTMGWTALNATPPAETQKNLEITVLDEVPEPAFSPSLL